jgi:alpha-tubulin suppressor-like RCC1 family protein
VGQVGLGENFSYPPTRHPKLRDIVNIACGAQHTIYIDTDNSVHGSGSCGFYTRYSLLTPTGTEFQLAKDRGVYCEVVSTNFSELGVEQSGKLKAHAGTSHTILAQESASE